MGNCPAASYFLKITQNDTEIKSLKIIKILMIVITSFVILTLK